jgi:hypothetical protein
MLYKVGVEQFPKSLLKKQKKNIKLISSHHMVENKEITIFCMAAGHEYFLEADTEKDALEKVLENKTNVPCKLKKE